VRWVKSKKIVQIEDVPDKWSLHQVDSVEGKLISRVLDDFDSVTKKQDYPIRMGVAVPVNDLDSKTQEDLGLVEDELLKVLRQGSLGRLYVVITKLEKKSFREFVAQVKRESDFEGIHSALKEKFSHLDVQMVAVEDKKWDMYRSIKNGQF